MSTNWQQKVVLITGASSGIGRSLASELGKRGAIVGLLARRVDALRELVAEIEAANGRALALPADVRDGVAVRAAALKLQEHFGP
ncbi:MAG TPA: SDR family NAD(P)-dependent oxidoreductase, partial [Pyrinomonadaceae bacterium]